MLVTRSFLMAFALIGLAECSAPEKNSAPEKDYYFSVSGNPNNLQTERARRYLETTIPKQKYTITNQSGLKWPYYRAFALWEPVIQDSLMPPHWFVHRMLPLKKNEIKLNEHLIKIELNTDSAFYYQVTVFTQQENGLRLTANTGRHFIDSAHLQKSDWPNYLLQSVLRDSFK